MNCVLKKVEAYFTEGWMIKLRNCNMVNQSWSSFINVKKKKMKQLVANIYLRESGFFIFIDICYEIDIRKEGPLIILKSKLSKIFFIKTKFNI